MKCLSVLIIWLVVPGEAGYSFHVQAPLEWVNRFKRWQRFEQQLSIRRCYKNSNKSWLSVKLDNRITQKRQLGYQLGSHNVSSTCKDASIVVSRGGNQSTAFTALSYSFYLKMFNICKLDSWPMISILEIFTCFFFFNWKTGQELIAYMKFKNLSRSMCIVTFWCLLFMPKTTIFIGCQSFSVSMS